MHTQWACPKNFYSKGSTWRILIHIKRDYEVVQVWDFMIEGKIRRINLDYVLVAHWIRTPQLNMVDLNTLWMSDLFGNSYKLCEGRQHILVLVCGAS
jgi:hypothetical protein